jgi:hypothetical protein
VAIARQTATKTLFGALGTAVTGINLSLDKNLFAQQTYQVIAVAMETRRTELFTVISNGLGQKQVTEYPLPAVKRDMVMYLLRGLTARRTAGDTAGSRECIGHDGCENAPTGGCPCADSG